MTIFVQFIIYELNLTNNFVQFYFTKLLIRSFKSAIHLPCLFYICFDIVICFAEMALAPRQFVKKHNLALNLDPDQHNSEHFHEMFDYIARSRLFFAFCDSPRLVRQYIDSFWSTAHEVMVEGHSFVCATVGGITFDFNAATLRTVLHLGAEPEVEAEEEVELTYEFELLLRCFQRMGFVGAVKLPFDKSGFQGRWRYLAYALLVCLSNRKAGFDQLSAQTASQMVALVYNRPYPFSRYFYQEFLDQINARGRKRFLLYPRFVMAIVRHFCPNLVYDQGPRYVLHAWPSRLFADLEANTRNVAGLNDPPLFGHLINPNYRSRLENDMFVDDNDEDSDSDDSESSENASANDSDDDSSDDSDSSDDGHDEGVADSSDGSAAATETDTDESASVARNERRTKLVHDVSAASESDHSHQSFVQEGAALHRERRSKACHVVPGVSDSAHSVHDAHSHIPDRAAQIDPDVAAQNDSELRGVFDDMDDPVNRASSVSLVKRKGGADLKYTRTKRRRVAEATSVAIPDPPRPTAAVIPAVSQAQVLRPLVAPSLSYRLPSDSSLVRRVDLLETQVRTLEFDLTDTRAALTFLINWVKNQGGEVPEEICRLSAVQPRRQNDDDDADNAGDRNDSRPVEDKGKGVEIEGETGGDTSHAGPSGVGAGPSGVPRDSGF